MAAHLEDGGSGLAGHSELADPAEGAHERGVTSPVVAEPDGGRRLDQVEVEAAGFLVEFVGEAAQQPAGAGAEDAEPEAFGVGGAGVVAEPVDERVLPGLDAEPVGREGGRRGHGVLLLGW